MKIKLYNYLNPLVVILLFSMTFFSCCNRNANVETGQNTTTPIVLEQGEVAVDLNKYSIVYPYLLNNYTKNIINDFQNELKKASGLSIPLKDDYIKNWGTPDDSAYEILIGNTNRPQSAEALQSINEYGYVIKISGNKIVINGSNELAVEQAVKDFMNHCRWQNSTLIMKEMPAIKDQFRFITLGDSKSANLSILAKKDDYCVELAQGISDVIFNLTGKNVVVYTDVSRVDTSKCVIHVGIENTSNAKVTLSSYDGASYTIYTGDNNFYIYGNTKISLKAGVERFKSILKGSIMVTDEKQTMNYPVDYAIKENGESVDFSFPEYFNAVPQRLLDNNSGYLLYLKGTNADEFSKYVKLLQDSGFTIIMENATAGNRFVTLRNESIFLHTYFTKYDNSVRIITEPLGYMPPTSSEKVTKITEPSVTQLALDYANSAHGMSYIVTLEDSSFIVIDGGYCGGSRGTGNAALLLNKLKALNKRSDGKIIISAWIVTHGHPDHYQVLQYVSQNHASDVTVEQIIINTASDTYSSVFSTSTGNYSSFNINGEDIKKIVNNFGGKVQVFAPHTGQIFFVRNAKFEVLYTYEDFFPEALDNYNSSSVMMRMTLAGQTFFWTGDTYIAGCEKAVALHGDYLKCDFVQMPHHGFNNAGGADFYKAVAAKVAFWPQELKIINNHQQTPTVKNWLIQAGTTRVFIASEDVTLTLPYPLS